MQFDEKVKSMTAKEIIMAMVEGLKNPVVNVHMYSFGFSHEGVCYGCAATNAICKISGHTFTADGIRTVDRRASEVKSDLRFLDRFEGAINYLRSGDVEEYNGYAKDLGFATILRDDTDLTPINDDNYKDEFVLQQYIDLANAQN